MAQQFSGLYSATNTDNALLKIKDIAVAAGWTLHDTIVSPLQYIVYSDGETPTANSRAYVNISGFTAGYINIDLWQYWNNSTHVGSYKGNRTGYNDVRSYDAASFDIFVVANLDHIFVAALYSSAWHFACITRYEPYNDQCFGTTDAAITAGSAKDLSLGSGEAAGFRVGQEVQIIGSTYREPVTVNSVNLTTDTVTVDDVAYSHASGAIVGSHPFPWYTIGNNVATAVYSYGLRLTYAGTTTAIDTTSNTMNAILFANAAVDPDRRTGLYAAFPFVISEADAILGFPTATFPFLRLPGPTSSLHTCSIGDQDSGTSTGSNTSTTLNDTGQSWTTDEWDGKVLIITAGTGVGQYREITSNTATAITVGTWTTTPDATSEYTIADECWLYFYFGNSVNCSGVVKAISPA